MSQHSHHSLPSSITHKFWESPVEGIAKAEIIRGLFNTTWLVTMACKSVSKDVGNGKFRLLGFSLLLTGITRCRPARLTRNDPRISCPFMYAKELKRLQTGSGSVVSSFLVAR